MRRSLETYILGKELLETPEYRLLQQRKAFTTSIFIFDHNYKELRSLVETVNRDPATDPLFTLTNRPRLAITMHHIIRLLHNYVAAAQSLIDHTRNLYKEPFLGSTGFPDYQPKVDSEFAKNPLSQFVKCLRVYCQHYRAPDLNMTFYCDRGDGRPVVEFGLLKSDLEAFSGWTATAREYIAGIRDEVDVLELASAYHLKIEAFYRWFEQRLDQIQAVAIRTFEEKQTRLILLQLEDMVDIMLANSSLPSHPRSGDAIFYTFFSVTDYEQLDAFPNDPKQRAQTAIAICEQRYFRLPHAIRQKIIQLYLLLSVSPSPQSNSDEVKI
jgi:hypothetical protein